MLAGIDKGPPGHQGKHYGAPIFDLLGGAVRDRIKIYSWIGGDRPSETPTAARAAVARGFGAVKMNGTSEMQFIDSWDKVDLCASETGTPRGAGRYPRFMAEPAGIEQRLTSIESRLDDVEPDSWTSAPTRPLPDTSPLPMTATSPTSAGLGNWVAG